MDIPNIQLVVQWRLEKCDINVLWQRVGRAARGPGTQGVAVILVDAKHYDEEKDLAEGRAQKRIEAAAKKAQEKEHTSRKRAATVTSDNGSKGRAAPRRRTDNVANLPTDRLPSHTRTVPVPRSSAAAPRAPLSKYEVLRVAFSKAAAESAQVNPSGSGSKKALNSTAELSPELDSVVNAGQREYKCYRAPIMAYYENDRIGTLHTFSCQSFRKLT